MKMNFKKINMLTILLFAVFGLVLSGCSDIGTQNTGAVSDNEKAATTEPTAADEDEIIEDLVVEENPEDVEIGSLI